MPVRRTTSLLVLALLVSTGCKPAEKASDSSAGGNREGGGDNEPPAQVAQSAQTAPPGPITVPPALQGTVATEGFAPIVERLSAAVVNISSTKIVRMRSRAPVFGFPFFGDGAPAPGARREQSLGSGVIVSEDGVILTNNHVVADADEVRVFLSDKRDFKARIIGTDPKTDIAVIKIDNPSKFAYAPFGDSSKVRVGDLALAIGNPFGIGQTVTMGIISAVGRGNMGIVDYEDFLQTDAAINPGNSGGALVNARGELIGINTAILAKGGEGNQGIGFAVPTMLARQIMDQILRDGHVVRGYMGVALQDVTPAVAEALGLAEPKGVLVGEVGHGAPADKAGIRRGDILLTLDGKPIEDSHAFRLQVAEKKPGTEVQLSVLRGEKPEEVKIVLGELPGDKPPPRASDKGDPLSSRLGITIADLVPELKARLRIPNEVEGVAIVEVLPGGRADAVGLRPGDVILAVGRDKIKRPEELKQKLEALKGKTILLLLLRGGRTHYVVIEPD